MKKIEEDVMLIDDQNNKLNKVRHGIFLPDGLQSACSIFEYTPILGHTQDSVKCLTRVLNRGFLTLRTADALQSSKSTWTN